MVLQAKWLVWLAVASACVLLTAVLYGESVNYGFMFDDGMDLPRATDRGFLAIFTSAGDSPYYRPIVLAFWKAVNLVLHDNLALALHVAVLVAHATNGLLVYLLGTRLHGRFGACLAALLFLTFPFSYQAVANSNAIFHPFVTGFLLATVILYLRWRDRSSPIVLGLAVATAVLAAFTHEYGMLVGAFVLLAEALWLAKTPPPRRLSAVPLLFLAVSVGFVVLWWLVPKWPGNWRLDQDSLSLNAAYFGQGVAYPIVGAVQAMWPTLSGRVLLAVTAFLAVAGLAHWSVKRLHSSAFSACWIVLAVALPFVTLPFSYVIDGPRLLYLSSAGIALLWGGTLAVPLHWTLRPARLLAVPGLALAVVIAFQGAQFVIARQALFEQGAQLVREMVTTATDASRPGRTYINLPSWLAFKKSEYGIGHSGVTMIPSYIGLGRFVYISQGLEPELASLAFDPTAKAWHYDYGPHGGKGSLESLEAAFRKGGAVYATAFYSDTLRLEYVGSLANSARPANDRAYLASIGDWARLSEAKATLDDRVVDIDLVWQSLSAAAADYTVFVHLVGADDKPIAQVDGYPIGATFPPQRWRPGDVIADHRRIALPAGTVAGSYRVLVGMYDRANGNRAPASSVQGSRLMNDAVSLALPVP